MFAGTFDAGFNVLILLIDKNPSGNPTLPTNPFSVAISVKLKEPDDLMVMIYPYLAQWHFEIFSFNSLIAWIRSGTSFSYRTAKVPFSRVATTSGNTA